MSKPGPLSTAFLLMAAGSAALLLGCSAAIDGSGTEHREVRPSSTFSKIELRGALDLEVGIGPTSSIEIRGDDNLVALIRTEIEGETLVIEPTESIDPELGITVVLTTPRLESISASGASDIRARNLVGEQLSVDLSGACDIDLAGEITRLELDLSGAADVKARDLVAQDVQLDISGAASAEITAKHSLDASISGAGSVDVWGNPAEIRETVSGAGSVRRR